MRTAVVILLCVVAIAPARGDEPAAKPHRYTAQLARECDELIAAAVKRPYGWGWGDAAEGPDPRKGAARNVPISLEPSTTPAAGLLLLYASELLNEPKYADAARNVGRGVAASQQTIGKFPAQALFGPTSAASKEALAPLPDRGATCACLGLLLSLMDEAKPQETIDRAASRGALWLTKQQAESGAWLTIYPPNAAVLDGMRIARLDTPEARDCILTMMLAYEVLGEPFQRRSVEKSLEFLLKARIAPGANIGAGLWRPACTAKGMAVDHIAEFGPGLDSLASRYSMQAIFSAWVVFGEEQRLSACDLASKSLDDLIKGYDGLWHRRFGLNGASLDPPPPKATNSPFGPPNATANAPAASDPGLAATVWTIAKGKELGREKFRERLTAHFTPKQHLALVACGLSDHPMAADFPARVEELAGYLKQHEAQFHLIDGEVPIEIAGKIRRLWALYLRARLESRLGA